jgi:starch-binding outer membrane protein SusE/F
LDSPAADWWQMEFNVINSKIEYRGKGGDQAAVPVTVGQKAVLNFSTGVGSIQ